MMSAHLLHSRLEHFHLSLLAVNEHDVVWIDVLDQLHDSLGIGMSGERHVFDLHPDLHPLAVDVDLLRASNDLGSDSSEGKPN